MKNINKIILGILLAVFSVSCQNEYEPLDEVIDVNFYTSFFSLTQANINSMVGKYSSFADLSQGALTHKWEIVSVDSMSFLKGVISNKDSVYDRFVVSGNESTDKIVNILYTKPGNLKLRLHNTYRDSVAIREMVWDATRKKNVYKPKPAVKIDGVWVIDTTFSVKVYDIVEPTYLIQQNGVDVTNSDTIRLKVSESLTFANLSLRGNPDTRNWNFSVLYNGTRTNVNFKESDPANTSTVFIPLLTTSNILTFTKEGIYTGNFSVTRTATGATSSNIPGSYQTVKIKSVIKVTQ